MKAIEVKMTANDTAGRTKTFLDAICASDVDTVRAMLADGMSPNAYSAEKSALMAAAAHSTPEMIDLLIDAGADPNARLSPGHGYPIKQGSALEAAANSASYDCLSRLLDRGADPSSPLPDKISAGHLLMFSAKRSTPQEQKKALALLRRMHELHLPLSHGSESRETVLHYAASMRLPICFLETLLDLGADPYAVDVRGESPLHAACVQRNDTAVDLFIKRGVDVSHATGDGRTVLHLADHPKILKAILELNLDLDAQDDLGRTPLADALRQRSLTRQGAREDKEKIITLLNAGASVDIADRQGVTPRDLIRKRRNPKMTTFLAARDARTAMANVAAKAKKDRQPT